MLLRLGSLALLVEADADDTVRIRERLVEFDGLLGCYYSIIRLIDTIIESCQFGIENRFVGGDFDGSLNVVEGCRIHAALDFHLFPLVIEIGCELTSHQMFVFIVIRYGLAIFLGLRQGSSPNQKDVGCRWGIRLGETVDSAVLEGKNLFYPSIWHENKAGNISVLDYSCALRTGASYNYLLVNGVRRPTSRELLRLQGFPEKFRIAVSHQDIRRQTGNSVAVPMIRMVAQKINQIIRNREYGTPETQRLKTAVNA